MREKANHLSGKEMYSLIMAIKEIKRPFGNWEELLSKLSADVSRKIVRSNVVSACENCEMELNTIVRDGTSSHPFANMMQLVRALEAKVENLAARSCEQSDVIADLCAAIESHVIKSQMEK